MEVPLRRPPPPFRRVTVARVERRTPRLVRVTFAGTGLDELDPGLPAGSVRLLIPSSGRDELVLPEWAGNEFLLPNGDRPVIRTFTPLASDGGTLALEIVCHGHGGISGWAEAARPGDPAGLTGPARGYSVDAGAPAYLVAGDESAMPAIGQVLAALPGGRPVAVYVEIATADAVVPDLAPVEWLESVPAAPPGEALVGAVRAATIVPGTKIWVAGEAAAVQRIRRHLFDERGLARSDATVRGYWSVGRAVED